MRYVTLDVFTDQPFSGNPLAVVLDADGLQDSEMHRLAAEFGYPETAFLFAPTAEGHDARMRVFTPAEELPFAGHPNIGAALALGEGDRTVRFQESVGTVHVEVRDGSAEVSAPQPFTILGLANPESVAAVCGLTPSVVVGQPMVATCGTAWVIAEVATQRALDDARAVSQYTARGAIGVMLYTGRRPVSARVFTPATRVREDPASGSAALGLAGLLAQREGSGSWTISQGVKLGRPSILQARADSSGSTWVSGTAVEMMRGTLAFR